MKGAKTFDSKISICNSFAGNVSNDVIKDEPMFFNSSFAFAYEQGGPITRSFLEGVEEYFRKHNMQEMPIVFDSRVHMLMPGWYPAIPGYHHDDVPRPPIPVGQHFITAGQPDYDNPRYKAQHILGLVNADICPTEFAIGECTMPEIPDGELIYREWHQEVKRLVADGSILPCS